VHRAIDTIRVGGKLSEVNAAAPGWKVSLQTEEYGGVTERGRRLELVKGVNLDVIPTDTGVTGWIEGSVPKYVNDGVNYPAATVGEASEVVRDWLDHAADVVQFDNEPMRVTRLDVVRDFELGDQLAVHDLLVSHSAVPVKGRKVKANYRDASENHAATIHVKTRFSGSGRLYDKRGESGELAANGILRFEAQERKSTLGRLGLELLGSLDVETAHIAGRRRFGWCGFDAQLVNRAELVEGIMLDKESRRWFATRLQLVGLVALMESNGAAPTAPDRKQDYRLRKALAEYGYPSTRTMRLDYDTGLIAA